jgi:hypothetical protein
MNDFDKEVAKIHRSKLGKLVAHVVMFIIGFTIVMVVGLSR